MMKKRSLFALSLCLILLIGLLAGCSAPNSDAGGRDYAQENAQASLSGSASGDSGSTDVLADRKLIRRIYMDAETEDLDTLLSYVNQRIAELGGYIESRNIQNGSSYANQRYRYAKLVIRIPAESLDSFVQKVGEESNIVSTTEESDDVTLQYVATESRLNVLRTEEERLLQFLSEVTSVSEMLEIEKRLTDVQSEIESITSQLNTYDNLVDYGTITLDITEVEVFTVVEEEEPTMWEEISQGFAGNISDLLDFGRALLVFLLASSPYLILIAMIITALILLLRRHERRQKRKNTPPAEEKTE